MANNTIVPKGSTHLLCKQGDDFSCKNWFNNAIQNSTYCCWYTEIVDFTLPTNANENPVLNKTLITMKYMGLPYRVGDNVHICMNNWPEIYGIKPNDPIPEDYQYVDKLGVKWRSYCDMAAHLAQSVLLLAVTVMITSF